MSDKVIKHLIECITALSGVIAELPKHNFQANRTKIDQAVAALNTAVAYFREYLKR